MVSFRDCGEEDTVGAQGQGEVMVVLDVRDARLKESNGRAKKAGGEKLGPVPSKKILKMLPRHDHYDNFLQFMVDATPQLKRKREEAAAQKKAKKQRKNEAAAALENGQPGTPATNLTPKSKNNSTPRQQPNVTPKTNGLNKDATSETPTTTDKDNKPEKLERKKDKKEKKEKKRKDKAEHEELIKADLSAPATKSKKPERYIASASQGGWFLPADPIFSPDEKYLLVADSKSLRVYDTETSLLVHALFEQDVGPVTAYALSASSPQLVYVAYSFGQIIMWDWVTAKKVGRWNVGSKVHNMAAIIQPESDQDFVYCHEADDGHSVCVRALRTNRQTTEREQKSELKQLLNTTSPIRGIRVLLQGKYIVVATVDSITIGKRVKTSRTALEEFEYLWREFKLSKHITTFDVYHREQQETSNAKKVAQDQRDIIDIAVGDDTGVVLLFEDILASIATIESSQKGKKDRTDNAESLRPKRLHWHRDAVGSVKWSLDGNYIISGGDETVLTIWQLATGLPQHLPHLSAAIENIVVSPTGSSYALTLASNSVIVLSTTELEARSNIIGIQSRRIDPEQLPKETKSGKMFLGIFDAVPTVVNPANPNEVIFAVPSSQPRQKREGLRPEPYLQTFDLANERAKARQALTRNNATEPNVAPDGGRIKEPTVTHIQVSHDGEWLATVDEWIPPRSDTGYLNEGIPEFNEQERVNRREVYLKIWRRDKNAGQWKLETRIDSPHFFEDVCGNGRVFDLIAHPAAAGFATVGEDHVVRVWKPKTRSRDGVVVRGAQQEGLITWSLDRTVEISDKLDITEGSQQSLPPRTSRLAFSADGSVLAVSISWDLEEDAGVTHLIDTHTATIRRSLTEIDVTALSGLGFVGQYLVVVADAITVWDMVSDRLAYSVGIETPGIGRLERVPLVRLATNETDCTFAVSLPRFEKNDKPSASLKKVSSKIYIHTPEREKAIFKDTFFGISLALTSRRSESGYVVLDSRSYIKTITQTAEPLQLPSPPPEKTHGANLRAIYPRKEEAENKDDEMVNRPLANLVVSQDLTQDMEHEEHVFNMQDLQNVLHDGTVPPPPQGLFSNLLALIGGRQKVAA
ncbi:small nucleolar ribonucleo [Pyrenophora seminiperda CCB06]|uniref:Small nucleolar ribonucleo n=1 Tax=Pyrenophora seminiperda CCB06 TaxID=1302712 RepID=A0A3M7MAR1_9PLEO|nr:small nucleolar ribonucleo [Pyrenophora seminiperda CCB06]